MNVPELQSLGLNLPNGYTLENAASRPDMYETLYDANHPMSSLWPKFITSTPTSQKYWPQLTDIALLASYQLLILHKDGETGQQEVVACANSIPVHCPLEELPDGGWEAILQTGAENYMSDNPDRPNLLSALGVTVVPMHRHHRLADVLICALRGLAKQAQFDALVVPLRPTKKSEHPTVHMEDYIRWEIDDPSCPGARILYDPWLRKHVGHGGKILKIAPSSMTIAAPAEQWNEWTGCDLSTLAKSAAMAGSKGYVEVPIPRALVPVQYHSLSNIASYTEPNVWVAHLMT